jgi:hypothetical protein
MTAARLCRWDTLVILQAEGGLHMLLSIICSCLTCCWGTLTREQQQHPASETHLQGICLSIQSNHNRCIHAAITIGSRAAAFYVSFLLIMSEYHFHLHMQTEEVRT